MDVLLRRLRRDAVPKIENMRPVRKGFHNIVDGFHHLLSTFNQAQRI